MTIDKLFGEGKTVHLNRSEYGVERVEQSYYKKDVIQFNTSTYFPLNATASNECHSYRDRQVSKEDLEKHMSVKCHKTIVGIPKKITK